MRHRPKVIVIAAAVALTVSLGALLLLRVDPSSVSSVSVTTPGWAWHLTVRPDGSAWLQYGSSAGDNARVPPGSVDFRRVVDEAARPRFGQARGGSHVALHWRNETEAKVIYLRDDRFFRALVHSLDAKWEHKGWRFDELRRLYPVYPAGKDR